MEVGLNKFGSMFRTHHLKPLSGLVAVTNFENKKITIACAQRSYCPSTSATKRTFWVTRGEGSFPPAERRSLVVGNGLAGFEAFQKIANCQNSPSDYPVRVMTPCRLASMLKAKRQSMMKRDIHNLTLSHPATYQIKVPGHLDASWADWGGRTTLTFESDDSPITTLTCVVDQAALHGLLRQLYSLGIPLISVICIEGDSEEEE